MVLKLIGYWRQKRMDPMDSVPPHLRKNLDKRLWQPDTSTEKYPWPGDCVDRSFWTNGLKEAVVEYLKSGHPCEHYHGYSTCRICGKMLSTFERTDGTWVWPDQMEHYIEEHDVVLPQEFMKSMQVPIPEVGEGAHPIEKDEDFWINWRPCKEKNGSGTPVSKGA